MKALTIKQPWAGLIMTGIKDIENRTWSTKFRGRVLIHASSDESLDTYPLNCIFNKSQLSELENYYTESVLCSSSFAPFGVILGSVEIVDCVQNHPSIWAEKLNESNICSSCWFKSSCYMGKKCPLNYQKPLYNFVLKNPIMFKTPIKMKGRLSFWESNIEICEKCGQPTDLNSTVDGKYYCSKHI